MKKKKESEKYRMYRNHTSSVVFAILVICVSVFAILFVSLKVDVVGNCTFEDIEWVLSNQSSQFRECAFESAGYCPQPRNVNCNIDGDVPAFVLEAFQ